jgi:hypothetical protein
MHPLPCSTGHGLQGLLHPLMESTMPAKATASAVIRAGPFMFVSFSFRRCLSVARLESLLQLAAGGRTETRMKKLYSTFRPDEPPPNGAGNPQVIAGDPKYPRHPVGQPELVREPSPQLPPGPEAEPIACCLPFQRSRRVNSLLLAGHDLGRHQPDVIHVRGAPDVNDLGHIAQSSDRRRP